MAYYVIATVKSWNIRNAQKLIENNTDDTFDLITDKEQLNSEYLEISKPEYIFFPHWSWIIPKDIYTKYDCVVFHMTDLPFGRGGSPLQNLIERGIYDTKISAIKVCEGLDTGPVYFKEPVNISKGNADEILSNISDIVFQRMIPRFLHTGLTPVEQSGSVVTFRRRTPEQSELQLDATLREVYDHIRMLDGEGYPPAFIRYGNKKIYFSNAGFNDGELTAKVKIEVDQQ